MSPYQTIENTCVIIVYDFSSGLKLYFNLWFSFDICSMQISIMFVTLEKISQTDPKYADIILLENYAAFQNR